MVLYFSAYFTPGDIRWQGVQVYALRLLPLKNVLFIATFILQMYELGFYNKSVHRSGGFGSANNSWELNGFWARGGAAIIVEFILTVVQHYCVHTNRYNPILATFTGVAGFAIWFAAAMINALGAASGEIYWKDSDMWYSLLWGETAMQSALCVLSIVMIVFAAIAWHRARKSGWRKTATAPVETV